MTDALGDREVLREQARGFAATPTREEDTNGGSDEGFFVVDRSGIFRVATLGPYIGVPSNAEIERELRSAAN